MSMCGKKAPILPSCHPSPWARGSDGGGEHGDDPQRPSTQREDRREGSKSKNNKSTITIHQQEKPEHHSVLPLTEWISSAIEVDTVHSFTSTKLGVRPPFVASRLWAPGDLQQVAGKKEPTPVLAGKVTSVEVVNSRTF